MEKEELYLLVRQYWERTISDQDLKKLKDYLYTEPEDSLLEAVFLDMAEKESREWEVRDEGTEIFEVVQQKISREKLQLKRAQIKSMTFLRSAAAVFVLVGIALLFSKMDMLTWRENVRDEPVRELSMIIPGQSKAKIILADGKEIELHNLESNASIKMDWYSLVKNGNGEISYVIADQSMLHHNFYNTIVVPKGGEYKLNLPDGSQVWLNASSSLRYPLNFGEHSRRVELKGEAYFDIVKKYSGKKNLPFVVQSGDQELEVLGTQFNINSYTSKIKTTLVEGAVQLRLPGGKMRNLSPNQQSIYRTGSGRVDVMKIDPHYTIAWKDGAFAFDNATLEEVLDCLSRWYDVSFDYGTYKKSIRFTGTISRYENIEKLLGLIEITNKVKFKIEGRRIMVTE